MLDEFRVRDESHRARLLRHISMKFGHQVPLAELFDETFGKRKGSTQAYNKVKDALEMIIAKRKLGYELIEVETKRRGKSLGIYERQQEVEGDEIVVRREKIAKPDTQAGEDHHR